MGYPIHTPIPIHEMMSVASDESRVGSRTQTWICGPIVSVRHTFLNNGGAAVIGALNIEFSALVEAGLGIIPMAATENTNGEDEAIPLRVDCPKRSLPLFGARERRLNQRQAAADGCNQ